VALQLLLLVNIELLRYHYTSSSSGTFESSSTCFWTVFGFCKATKVENGKTGLLRDQYRVGNLPWAKGVDEVKESYAGFIDIRYMLVESLHFYGGE
jgi:hypothetical protein